MISAVGRAKAGPHKALYDFYTQRLQNRLALKEVELKKNTAPSDLKEREGALLLATLPTKQNHRLVALDGGGRTLSSEKLAALLHSWEDQGVALAVFAIGGAHGHGANLLQHAHLTLSLGAMTWPHMLVRGMMAEQLYRAQQIMIGHPYHHGEA